ncbi:MAG: D-alanyl-D-alanine carboxypeptidase family protein [Acidimicrobiia bacterium]
MKSIRTLAALVAVAMFTLILPAPAPAAPLILPTPPREGGVVAPAPPQVSAQSWILYDADAGAVLASSNADQERPMASTTKIMTCLLALKYGNLDDLVTVSRRAADVGESEVGLVPGERLPLRLLMTAMVVRSANDAAMAVAEHIGGSVDRFVDMMNAQAEEMGLQHTHFENPHGLDTAGHYSSAADLLAMGLAVMQYPQFRELARIEQASFPPAPDGTQRRLETTNKLLGEYPGTIGVKTGYTGRAGLVMVAAAQRDGRTLFSVVMGSSGSGGHFKDAAALMTWGFDHFGQVAVAAGSSRYEPPQTVEAAEPQPQPQPQPEPEPVVVETVRSTDGNPPDLGTALGWLGLVFSRLTNG